VRKIYGQAWLLACAVCFSSPVATAQMVEVPVQAQPEQSVPSVNSSLDGISLKEPSVGTQSLSASSYPLSGTSISGYDRHASNILTASILQDAAAYKTESGIYLYPTAFVGFGHNDNIKLQSANVQESNVFTVAPQLIAELRNQGDRYTATAFVNRTTYSNSSQDDYVNSKLEVAADHYFDVRSRMGWSVGLVNSIDARGSYSVFSDEPDRWHSTNANGKFIYGADGAKGRAEVDLGVSTKTYDNNRFFSSGNANTANRDVDVVSVAGRLFYRLGSRSKALVEVRNAKYNYRAPTATETNTERKYYFGYTWEATAATTGIVKYGYATRDFDTEQPGYSGSSWEATMRWLPKTYSVFDLLLGRYPTDSSGVGNYDLTTNTQLTWNHHWSESLSSAASVTYTNTSYGGATRVDSTNTYSLAMAYAVQRWLKIGVDVSKANRTSNTPLAEYRRALTMLTLNVSL